MAICAIGRQESLEVKKNIVIGLVDADLLDNGTRHPNLVILKLAGYFRDHHIPYELIFGESVDIERYDRIYLSKVFTFTNLPSFIVDYKRRNPRTWSRKIQEGGTGFYATEEDHNAFNEKRREDMSRLNNDPLLPNFSMAHQMPDYNVYNHYIDYVVSLKVEEDSKVFLKKYNIYPDADFLNASRTKHKKKYKDYLDYSIGFLTRGCIRQCPFCVNKGERGIHPYSNLEDFVDKSRPFIYLWDDNFLCYKNWKELLQKLIDTGKPFQFRQGLDERVIDEERAKMLSKAHYHGDFIFAFDQWKDCDLIVRKLRIWKTYCPSKTTKFYLFCGYELTADNDTKIFEDVYYLFRRIQILMSFGCLGYVMRHADYQNHRLGNIYTQIARWCNQPQFYKKMSFEEFILRNQSYQEEHSSSTKTCKSLSTYTAFKETFFDRWNEIEPLFHMKYESTIDKSLWTNNNE